MSKAAPIAEAGLFGGAEAPAPSEMVTVSKSDLDSLISAKVVEALAGMQSAAPSAISSDATALFQGLALSIAEMTHQTNRTHKPVDPKVLAARAAGLDRLEALLAQIARDRKDIEDQSWETESEKQAAIKSVTPRYRVISAVNLDDDLIMPVVKNLATKQAEPVAIFWAKAPNDALAPLNDIAKEVHAAFRDSRGARTVFEKQSIKPTWTTENGLVVQGRAPKRREVEVSSVIRDAIVGDPAADPYLNVLGTKHRPFETTPRPLASKFEGAR